MTFLVIARTPDPPSIEHKTSAVVTKGKTTNSPTAKYAAHILAYKLQFKHTIGLRVARVWLRFSEKIASIVSAELGRSLGSGSSRLLFRAMISETAAG